MEDIDDCPLLVESQKQDEEYQLISGRRIVDINFLLFQLQKQSNHCDLFDCKEGYFQVIGEKRIGLMSKIKLKCNICQNLVYIDSENPENEHRVNINIAAATGIVATGIGQSQFEELFSAIDIPVFSNSTYTNLQNIVYDNWEKTAPESMEANANLEREAAIAEGRVKDGLALVDVYVDGAWSSRSYGNNYRANSGTAAIIGAKYGKVLYMSVKNKYCLICARAEKKGEDPKTHTCYKNYSGSSSAMEADIICDGFKQSKDMYGIIYARMIADGDSSTYAKILEAAPYPNHIVEKIECRNHILRNFCNKLRTLTKDTKYSLAHRKTLNNIKIMSMRKMIVKSIKHHHKSNASKNVSITKLHNDIKNSMTHAYGDHRLCEEYNCTKEKGITGSTVDFVKNSTFLFRMNAIIATAANKARSLIENVDTNSVERFNSVVAKFVGGKRINFSQRRGYQARCAAAVVSFNDENSISSVQKAILGTSPKGMVKEVERRRSIKRKLHQEHPTKKIRKINDKQKEHNYGPTCLAPDMTAEQLEKAKEDYLNNLADLTADRDKIQKNTILQKDSSEWMEIRKKLVTASNFGAICKRKIAGSTAPLVKKLLYQQSLAHVTSVAHGIENEKQALQQLELQENIHIQPCGLFIDKEYAFIGATPDGLVGEDSIVEIKCPITAFKTGIDRAIQENKIQLYKYNKKSNTRSINKNSNWYYQVQGQLHVTEKNMCIFGIWSGEKQPLLVEIIFKDDEFWNTKMKEKILNFYLKCLLTEIVDPRQIRGMPIRDITLSEDTVQKHTTITLITQEEQTALTPSRTHSPAADGASECVLFGDNEDDFGLFQQLQPRCLNFDEF